MSFFGFRGPPCCQRGPQQDFLPPEGEHFRVHHITDGTEAALAPPTEGESLPKQRGREAKESKSKKTKEFQDTPKEKESKDKLDKKAKDTSKKGAPWGKQSASKQPVQHSYKSSPEPPEHPAHRKWCNSFCLCSLCHSYTFMSSLFQNYFFYE